ncbi:zinc finger protein 367-like isoform X3 [Tachypleus tridentatus]|uniref:zinc finger protein 367-like isoform X3 n=1 Tax=Tachypleus tridentatus TaxID=6853 RepID=UPI003FD269E7
MNSSPLKDLRMYSWNWGEGASEIQLSPGNLCSPELLSSSQSQGNINVSLPKTNSQKQQKEPGRRGRSRLVTLTNLILEGSSSGSTIKCHICNRVFPRGKSLQAHLWTHTGCTSRFTHANRHCSHHPGAVLRREQSTFQQLGTPSLRSNENSHKQDIRHKRHGNGNSLLRQRNLQEELLEASLSNENYDSAHNAELVGALALLELAQGPATQI